MTAPPPHDDRKGHHAWQKSHAQSYTPCSCKYAENDIGVKPKSRSTLLRSVMLSKLKSVIAALVNGGLGRTASIRAAPTPTRGVGAGALIRVLCIAWSSSSMTWVKV